MFESLVSSIDEVLRGGPSPHPCGDAVETLQRQRNRLDYATACEVAAFDTNKAWSPDGAYNAAAWLATKLRIPPGEAHRLVRVGAALGHMPLVDAAFATGDLTLAHVDTSALLRRPNTAEAFTRDEAWLVEQATTLTFKQFRCVTHTWDETADPERAVSRARAARATPVHSVRAPEPRHRVRKWRRRPSSSGVGSASTHARWARPLAVSSTSAPASTAQPQNRHSGTTARYPRAVFDLVAVQNLASAR